MQLVKGYTTNMGQFGNEVLYAVTDTGEVYYREVGKVYPASFCGGKITAWHRAFALPDCAEFIGHYPKPFRIK